MADYELHATYINWFKSLADAHPDKCDYVSAGKTFVNTDIWLFRIGNPGGGPVLLDSCMHGMEDMGTQIGYRYMNWLLTSEESKAQQILEQNYTLLIPVVNNTAGTQYDRMWCYRGNRNLQELPAGCPYGGIDLNRNFVHGWVANQSCCTPDCCGGAPTYCSACYHGEYGGSEPETQVMRQIFNDYLYGKPSVYLNTHFGGGPWLGFHSNTPSNIYQPIINRIAEISADIGVTWLYPAGLIQNMPNGGTYPVGFAISDAYLDYGAVSIAWEMFGSTTDTPCWEGHAGIPDYPTIDTCVFPICQAVIFAMSEYCAVQEIPDGVIDATQVMTIQVQ